jgi:sRNA-binding carbon storage regulator CsrA/predicted transcriptional regulator
MPKNPQHKRSGLLLLTREKNEQIIIDIPPSKCAQRAIVKVASIHQTWVQLGFEASRDVVINRAELAAKIEAEGRKAQPGPALPFALALAVTTHPDLSLEVIMDAIRFVVEDGPVSITALQRRFNLGYVRASQIMQVMEEAGIVGPHDPTGPRDVLMTPDEYRKELTDYRQGLKASPNP